MKKYIGLSLSAAFGAIVGSSMARWLTADHPLWVQIGWIGVCVVLGAVLAAFAYSPRESARVCKDAYLRCDNLDWKRCFRKLAYILISATGFTLMWISFVRLEDPIESFVQSHQSSMLFPVYAVGYIVSAIGVVVAGTFGVMAYIVFSLVEEDDGGLKFWYTLIPFTMIMPISTIIISIAVTVGLIWLAWKVLKNISVVLWAIATIVVFSLCALTKCPTRHAAMGGGAIGTLVGYFGKNPIVGGLIGGAIAVSLSLFATYAKRRLTVYFHAIDTYWRNVKIA